MNKIKIASALQVTLANSFTLYLETHKFHWNVVGANFGPLHLLFEEQYNDLWESVDLLAERVRALDMETIGTYRDFLNLSSFEITENNPDALTMINILIDHNEQLVACFNTLAEIAEEEKDQGTLNIAADRIDALEKSLWKLKSTAK